MKRINHKKNLTKSIILLLILAIGIGYAYLTSNLSINGSTEVVANSWNIHFENLNVTTGSVTATTPATIASNTVDITYAITLSRPKEFYEFTVDIKNDGTLPGKVSISSLAGITSAAEPIIDYSITYTNGNPVQVGDILNAGAKKTIKVRVFYKDDINPGDFPSNDLTLTLTYTLQYIQSEESEFDTGALIEQLKTENSSCFTKYEGQVTDQPGQTVTSSNVYLNKCADKRNIKFANLCWQIVRTTETGGIKMIYNGEPDNNGECGTSRGDHIGLLNSSSSLQMLNSEYLYGSSFTYDTTNSTFTLTDTETATWSDSTYENLLSKYTCKNTTGTCTTLYNVNGYHTNTQANTAPYTMGNVNYSGIGRSPFNANDMSPAMAGYMFNVVYKHKLEEPETNTYKYGNTFTYSNGIYTLSGTTQNISDWSTGYNQISNTHYTCWNSSGTCNTISYIYYTDSFYAYYIDLINGKSINDALNEMLSNNDVNNRDSSIKGILDVWYKQNLLSKTNMLEDTVYCNARDISNYGGWNPNGGNTASNYYLQFHNYNLTSNLSCPNETDQFAVSNNKAKLTYPIGMISHEEWFNIGGNTTAANNLRKTNIWYWSLSPYVYGWGNVSVRGVDVNGNLNNNSAVNTNGYSRPSVTLASGLLITEGTGSETDPWVIEE